MTEKYCKFLSSVRAFIPEERIYTDYLRRLAWGTDAGFYRLTPQIVLRAANESEMLRIIAAAAANNVPLTFRAAGTSLSGQSVSDSVLVVAAKNWEGYEVLDEGRRIRLQPGVIGAKVSEVLKPYGCRFSPDPASVKSAMVGGIVMNNASGMNCGTHANSDKVLQSMRIIFSDGSLLDTGSKRSCEEFASTHYDFLAAIEALRDKVRADKELSQRIRQKYAIKNVVGLNLLPLVQHDNVFDIVAHLMVGSEGTLGFMSEVTMLSERDYEYKASAMLYFASIDEACRAVVAMRPLCDEAQQRIVHSAELLDSKSLASVNDPTGENLTAVLTETKAHTQEDCNKTSSVLSRSCSNSSSTRQHISLPTKPSRLNIGQFVQAYSPRWEARAKRVRRALSKMLRSRLSICQRLRLSWQLCSKATVTTMPVYMVTLWRGTTTSSSINLSRPMPMWHVMSS